MAPEHGAQADDQGDVSEDPGEALLDEGVAALDGRADKGIDAHAARQRHEHAGTHQGNERFYLDFDDQKQQEGNARTCQEKQAGRIVAQPVQEFIHGGYFLGIPTRGWR